MFNFNNKKGFTLIELVVVLIIIGILVLLAVPRFTSYADKAKYTNIINDIRVVEDVSLINTLETNSSFPAGTSKEEEQLDIIASEYKIFARDGVIIKQSPNEEGRLPDVGEVSDILVSDLKNGFHKLDKENFILPNTRTRLKGDFYIDKDLNVVYRSSIRHGEDEFIVIDDTGLFKYYNDTGKITGYNKDHEYFKDDSNQKSIDGTNYYILPPIPDYRILKGEKIPVTEIGGSAFNSLQERSTGEFIAGNNLEKIGSSAFKHSKLTGSFYSKNIKTIGNYAFYNNNFTGDFVAGDKLEKIGSSAFKFNDFSGNFHSKNIKTIEIYAFYNNNFTGKFIPPERYNNFKHSFNNDSFSNVQ